MSAGTIEIIKGDDVTLNLTFTNSDGSAFDLTGCTVFFTVKQNISDTDANAAISKQWSNHTNPTQGLTSVALLNADTEPCSARTYVYDFQIKDADTKIISSGVGNFIVAPEVTVRTA